MTRKKKLRLLQGQRKEQIKIIQGKHILLQTLHQKEEEMKIQLQEIEKMFYAVAKQLAILDQLDASIKCKLSKCKSNA